MVTGHNVKVVGNKLSIELCGIYNLLSGSVIYIGKY